MTAHSSGAGTTWNETLDVDQPHGLDFQEWNDIRIGTRKRMAQEHAAFADNTVGGQHTPGGAGVLLLETTANMTTLGAAADLTSAHEFGIACNTAADPTGSTLFYFGDDTVPVTLPVSWNNILTDVTHTVGAEITIGPPVVFQNTADFSANINVDSSADFSDVFVAGDLSMAGDLMADGSFLPTSCATDFGGYLDEDALTSDASASAASQQSIKAYVDSFRVKGMGTVASDGTLQANSLNITSVVRDAGGGFYTITWDTDFANTNYVVIATAENAADVNMTVDTILVGSCIVRGWNTAGVKFSTDFHFSAFGDQ